MPVEFDNETFAQEFARRLNRLVREFPSDMFHLGGQALPTGTESGSMVLWRVFSLLCLEGAPGYLIVPHQSHTAIGAIHAIPASDHDAYRTKRKPLPPPDTLPPQMGNDTFAREMARRINLLASEYPKWVETWLAHDIVVRHEMAEDGTKVVGFLDVLSLVCSADVDDDPFGIALVNARGLAVCAAAGKIPSNFQGEGDPG